MTTAAGLVRFRSRPSGELAGSRPERRAFMAYSPAPLVHLAMVFAVAKRAIERPEPVATVRLLPQAVGQQQIAQLTMGADDAKRHVTSRQLVMKIVQHSR